MKLFQNPIWLLLICTLAACKQEYYPKIKSTEKSVLVVDGVLNSDGGPTTVSVTQSFKLDDSAAVQPVTGAWVTVESSAGAVFQLEDINGNGKYSAAQLPLDPAEKYRLHISTPGAEYASDYVPVLKNPPIDSVSWKRNEAGINIYVNTHNPENDTRYYRWEFEETWEVRAVYFSNWKMVNDVPTMRNLPEEDVFFCWRHYNSSHIILSNTTHLSSDVVFEKPLIAIEDGSEKLGVRYSILVRQYGLNKEGYAFYQLLQKNTESLGSIFDPQPTEISSNMHCISDSAQKVIGYVSAAPVRETRIFIANDDVPGWKFYRDCSEDKDVPNNPDSIRAYFNGEWLPYDASILGGRVLKYYAARPACTDCTVGGGKTEKPSFW